MKRIFNRFIILLLAVAFLGSCEDDFLKPVLNQGAIPSVTLSASNVVLTKENAAKDALTVTWPKPDYGFNAGAGYTILFDKKGGNFSKAVAVSTGVNLTKTFKVAELNSLLLSLGIVAGTAADLDLKVESKLGTSTVLASTVMPLKATAYLDKLDLSTIWGLVGSATTNGWDGPDMPFYTTDQANTIVAYVTLKDGEVKIRSNNKWDLNYGDDGANGSLEVNGANIAVKAGTYKITFNTAALSYTIEKFGWGLVGSATPNGWDGPDAPFFYDPSSDQWRLIVTLKDGDVKIRKNNDWGTNYGDTGADKILESNGDNIKVTAGTYLVTVDFKSLKYTIEPIKIYGIVGSATANGWDGPDAKFTPDFFKEGNWVLKGITLKDGEVKFRQNDDWAVNYGDDGANGSLEAGGANIVVKAGVYDITLDFSVASSPTYKMVKR